MMHFLKNWWEPLVAFATLATFGVIWIDANPPQPSNVDIANAILQENGSTANRAIASDAATTDDASQTQQSESTDAK